MFPNSFFEKNPDFLAEHHLYSFDQFTKDLATTPVVFKRKIAGKERSLQISVKDNGPGIPAEHLPRLFERFYRVDKSRAKMSGGSGLGLSIVKHIVKAHGSQITVISKVDKGTSFSFKLEKA